MNESPVTNAIWRCTVDVKKNTGLVTRESASGVRGKSGCSGKLRPTRICYGIPKRGAVPVLGILLRFTEPPRR